MAHKINRKFMPQIDEKDLVGAMVWLAKIGVYPYFKVMDSVSISHHQNINEKHVQGIMQCQEALAKPLIVSSHGVALDGNHRGAAHKRLGTKDVPVIVVPLAYEDALLALAECPLAYSYGDGNFHPISS